ncbi:MULTISPECIES: tRNA uridine-5-carboxymethylaminomethyl(34) synthesis GTPase MnmE [unclassified Novosphingobium]|uniref:tRNA uridine-5-carboxymethylaminomethyl(34) synthesis GTPase MnmE n=1 Tax=unclassified Novosphingobium TaxID=2644732 RepID=UPI00146E098C|nr:MULTISPECIES: tRNA uridine-5-carboxymethylaminomethyl(34) synthesis GTPase MnmE [unclassified Novosphingobium]NMN05774.1 tRNA modification GTPase [Novosphingobium sp. SG919]NMN87866.1 tRNA modification GTPase [Novosphingobium sp. SG916]
MSENSTIFALSSGAPPAGIAVVRVSGPQAGAALVALSGKLPSPRRATFRRLVDPIDGSLLDATMVLWLPGPQTATGEDSAELHLHGGRAVVGAVLAALGRLPGLRGAQAGEFTRRAFLNGRIDLNEAEGLADLLSAETELQRRSALAMADGALSRRVEDWRQGVLTLSAQLEALLDFSDEDDVGEGGALLPAGFGDRTADLATRIAAWLDRPRAEPLREGFRVVLAGPPNAGKSTLFNALVESEAAITAAEPGTTRDVLTRSVAIDGVPFTFADTAGLREEGAGEIERIGIARARAEAAKADLILWLGPEGEGPQGLALWELAARADDPAASAKASPRHRLSAHTGEGVDALRRDLVAHARASLPAPGEAALNARQHDLLVQVHAALTAARDEHDPLLAAEQLRLARRALDALTGRAGTEDMLDALFGRFCIGK